MPNSLQPHGLQHARLPCPSPSPGICSNSRPLNQWYHPTVPPSVIPFSSCPQSFPASGSFPRGQLLTSSGQSFGALASAAVVRTRLVLEWPCLKSSSARSAWPYPETLWTPGLEEHRERWSPSLWGSHRSQGITERLFAAIVTQRPGVSPQPRDKRETPRPVFCRVRDPWAGSVSASWLCHHGNQYLWLSYIQL